LPLLGKILPKRRNLTHDSTRLYFLPSASVNLATTLFTPACGGRILKTYYPMLRISWRRPENGYLKIRHNLCLRKNLVGKYQVLNCAVCGVMFQLAEQKDVLRAATASGGIMIEDFVDDEPE
jgi:hypothetical protein